MFDITRNSSRAAAIPLQKDPQLNIGFGDYNDLTSFNRAVDRINQTHIGKSDRDEALTAALKLAKEEMFGKDKKNAIHEPNSNILIVLVNKLNNKYSSTSMNKRLAESMQKDGVSSRKDLKRASPLYPPPHPP